VLSFEELKALARGAVDAIEGSTPAPVTVLVVVANEHPHREDLARYAAEWNLARKEDVAYVCRLIAKAAEAA
jgi:hypothetical protein